LDIINNRSKKNIKEEDIINITELEIHNYINSQILDEKKIKEIISKYVNYSDFRKNEQKLYQKLLKNKTSHKFTNHLLRDIIYWSIDDAKCEVDKYKYLLDFIENSTGCYSYIKKNNLEYLLINLKRRNRELLNDELVIAEISKYKKLSDFREKSPKYYAYIKRHKKFILIEKLSRHKNWVNRNT
jgi:hypothetical protein